MPPTSVRPGDHAQIVALVSADLACAQIDRTSLAIIGIDISRPADADQIFPDWREWIDEEDPPEHLLLLRVGASMTSLDPSLNFPDLVMAVASIVQDRVMDELNAPWPFVDGPQGPRVLQPATGPNGEACWAADGRAVVAIGSLRDVLTPRAD